MNRTLVLATALAAGLAVPSISAQAAAPAKPATAPANVKPEAIPAKVAIISFQQVVVATNEGQRAIADVQKKYEPQKQKIDAEGAEIDSLKKQVQSLPSTTTDEERASRLRTIDEKEKQLQRDEEDASNAYQGDLQDAFAKVAQKVGAAAVKYAQDNGFTMIVNIEPNQQAPNPIMWWEPGTDISQAVVNAYNASSGVAPPTPSAPAPHRTTPSTGAHTGTH
ncbi:MAG TPA: OmpH family outer membrane protein [Candidatus Aquilonibacter sp.]|nr:OmpH family outer membrane protein [Candidatus Aquilonibacter sp.]